MADAPKTQNCMICGSRVDYLKTAETLICSYCARPSNGHIRCSEGHFVCDTCHGRDALPAIEEIVRNTAEKDPVRTAELLMAHPSLPMLGCEHAYIAAGALLAALRNSPYARATDADIREVFDRTAKQAVGGYCGLTGVCGIAPALGACFSVFLQARCGSDAEQKIVMEAVIQVSQAIAALTGPSCCKAYVRTGLDTAVTFFADRFGIVLPVTKSPAVCRHSAKHPHGCREERCPYYQKVSGDIFADAIDLKPTVCHS